MSRRSRRRHRQQHGKGSSAPAPSQPASKKQIPKARKGRALFIGAAVVVVGAALFAVNGSRARKGQIAAASGTNSAVSRTSAPAPPMALATARMLPAAVGFGPRIVFATPVYDFGQVKGGEVVKYAYVFSNAGNAMLQVSNVQVACGCTTAGEWTKQVEPGKTGSIPIQFNSGSYSGAVGKPITVTCNDTNQPTVVLQIKGTVWRAIDVTPQFAVLNVAADAPSNATTVRIVNNDQAPLTLSAPESNNRMFAAELRTNQPGKDFEMVVKSVPPLEQNLYGQITLKTSSTNMPVITLTAYANVQQAVMVMPSQIALPTAPLANALSTTISILNNGTNALVLSEAKASDKSVDLQLKEIQAGRLFTLTANFPAGFEIAPGQTVDVSLNSNHPQFATIRVPVVPPPRPTASMGQQATPAAAPSPSN